MKILLIEDEQNLQSVIKDYLETEAFQVTTASTGSEALSLWDSNSFDFVVTDLMLPDISGEKICKHIRLTSEVPILMLTAKTQLDDRLEGLSIGADDYMTKPFSVKELVMRIKVISRRVEGLNLTQKNNFISSLDEKLILRLDARRCFFYDTEVILTKYEFDLLESLMSHPEVIFSREQLIDVALGEDFIGYDRTIDTHIKNIRKKLEQINSDFQYIRTVYGLGYRFSEGR